MRRVKSTFFISLLHGVAKCFPCSYFLTRKINLFEGSVPGNVLTAFTAEDNSIWEPKSLKSLLASLNFFLKSREIFFFINTLYFPHLLFFVDLFLFVLAKQHVFHVLLLSSDAHLLAMYKVLTGIQNLCKILCNLYVYTFFFFAHIYYNLEQCTHTHT